MSELKGTVLGIILTLVLFGTVSAVLTAAFNIYNDRIKEEVKQTTIENDKGDCLPIVNIKYQLESQVPDDIYSYIIS